MTQRDKFVLQEVDKWIKDPDDIIVSEVTSTTRKMTGDMEEDLATIHRKEATPYHMKATGPQLS